MLQNTKQIPCTEFPRLFSRFHCLIELNILSNFKRFFLHWRLSKAILLKKQILGNIAENMLRKERSLRLESGLRLLYSKRKHVISKEDCCIFSITTSVICIV